MPGKQYKLVVLTQGATINPFDTKFLNFGGSGMGQSFKIKPTSCINRILSSSSLNKNENTISHHTAEANSG